MNARRAVTVAVLGLVLGTSAACQNVATGTPTPESGHSTSSESGTSSDPDSLAPPVEEPKVLTGIDPCALLTASQLAELSIAEPGVKDKSVLGEDQCTWQVPTVSLGLSPDTKHDGLEDVYRSRENFDNFEPSEVDGYPAVRVNAGATACSLWVGVAEGQMLGVHYGVGADTPDGEDMCENAESVASTVLKNLPDA